MKKVIRTCACGKCDLSKLDDFPVKGFSKLSPEEQLKILRKGAKRLMKEHGETLEMLAKE